MSEVQDEMQPGLTVVEKQNLINDLNTLAEGLGELDRGVVAAMVESNAVQKLLIEKGVFTAEELAGAMRSIFQAMQANSEQAIADLQKGEADAE